MRSGNGDDNSCAATCWEGASAGFGVSDRINVGVFDELDGVVAVEGASEDVRTSLPGKTESSLSGVTSVVVVTNGSDVVRDMDDDDVARLDERDFFEVESRFVDFRFSFFSGVGRTTGSGVTCVGVAGGVGVNDRIELRDKRAREDDREAKRGAPDSSTPIDASFCAQNSLDLL